MLDETRITSILEECRKKLRSLETVAKETPDDVMSKVILKEKIDLLNVILGEERKRNLRDQVKKLDVTELEVLRGSILVIEQLLVARGFTNQEEITSNLIAVIKHLRETDTKKWN